MKIYFNDDRFIEIVPLDDSLSQAWYDEVKLYHKNIRERDRFYGLNEDWSLEQCKSKIQECMTTINNFCPGKVPAELKETIDHEYLNYLHVFFENTIGLDKTTRNSNEAVEFMKSAPEDVREAVRDYNVIIHRMEGLLENHKKQAPRIVVTFKSPPKHEIPESELGRFDFLQNPGDVCLNYAHVGKALHDVFKDDDDLVGDANIKPQSHWSANFQIVFSKGRGYNPEYHKMVEQWWNSSKSDRVKALGFKKGDPKNAWGKLTVGKVVSWPDLTGIKYIDRIEFE
jgi:hypothetical protein